MASGFAEAEKNALSLHKPVPGNGPACIRPCPAAIIGRCGNHHRFASMRSKAESRRVRLRLLMTCLAGILGTVLAVSCRRGDAGAKRERPSTFVFARGSDAEKLDPADVDDGESVNSMVPIFEGLVQFRSGTLDIEPWLAEAFEILDDGLRYVFHLRHGVRFHDGTPLNAETALFSFARQMDPEHPAHFEDASFAYWSYLYQDISEVRAAGPMTLEFRMHRPNASILHSLAVFPAWLISPGALETYGAEMPRYPVGTGPYRFVSWKPNQAIIYERNPEYWGEPAQFERLVLRSVPDNTVRLLELKSGNIRGLVGLQPAELADLVSDPKFTVYRGPGMNVGYLAFSHFCERLGEPKIRQAIGMAIDREAMVRLALDGYGQVADYPLPPGFLGVPDRKPAFRYDPDGARLMLAEFKDRWKSPIELHTLNAPRPYFPDPLKIASLIRSDLEKVGLPVKIITRDFKSHLHVMRRGEFDMGLLGWTGDNGDPDNFLSVFFGSWAAKKGAATNISFYRNSEMDVLLLAGRKETDRAQRQKIYEAVLARWALDLPLIPLIHTEQIAVMRREVTGFKLQKTGNIRLGPVGWESLGME